MSTSEKREASEKELSNVYQEFMMAAIRVSNAKCENLGLPYTETAEYKKQKKFY